MSLRARMTAGLAMVLTLLIVAGLGIYALQHSHLVGQLDTRLDRQVSNATVVATSHDESADAGQARGSRGLADTYIGVIADQALRTLNTPTTDPGLTPVIDPNAPPPTPSTVSATGGNADRMRILTSPIAGGELVVLGRSMAEVDAALTGLRTVLIGVGLVLLTIVGIVFWWMRRLGLDPILRVTDVARSHTAGDAHRRVEDYPTGTEAHDLGVAFNRLIDTNEEAQARLRQFVADASHELRTPLVTLKGYASLHGAGGLEETDTTADAMRRMKQEANRMSRLVEGLLLLTEMDRAAEPPSAPVDVVPILADVATDLQVLAPDRAITVEAPHDAVVAGDRDELTQVFSSLTSNALRHTPPRTAIHLRVTTGSTSVRVEVADDGPGIAADDLPHVFDRFYRSGAARARASGGSGLGLAIAKAIVTAHRGAIGVDSPPGQGATFWVELPMFPAP